MEIPMYQLFHEGDHPRKVLNLPRHNTADDLAWDRSEKHARMLDQFRHLLSKVTAKDQQVLLWMAQKMAGPSRAKA